MLFPELEENLRNARLALDVATSENIIELCKHYLARLAEYRSELYGLPDKLDLNLRSGSSSSRKDVDGTRKAVRAAIEHTTREREWAEALILSFTAISGYGAIETLNRHKYKGHDDWVLSAGGASRSDAASVERMTIQETVETASLLRREEHVAKNVIAAGA
ncbi:MAG TPA: hypothetical protein VF708_03665 [Pyrinomonadaceae bacterium]|jgi:hypothetical protein